MSKLSSIKGKVYSILNYDPEFYNKYKKSVDTDCEITELKNLKIYFEANSHTQISDIMNLNDSIIYLDLQYSNFKDTDLERLPVLNKVKTLDISKRGRVPAFGLTFLHKFPNLENLVLKETFISPKKMARYSDNPKLRNIILNEGSIDTVTLRDILKNYPISTIDFKDSKINDDTLKCFEYYNKLKSVDLTNTSITNKGLLYLRENSNLHTLKLCKLKAIDDIGASIFEDFQYLESIDISGTSITNTGISYLNCVETLTEFYARANNLESINELTYFHILKDIDIGSNLLDDDNILNLSTCKTIKKIVIDNCKIKYGDVFTLLPQLETLIISFNPLSKSFIRTLLACGNLKNLNIDYCDLDYKDLLYLTKLPKLAELDCSSYDYSEKVKIKLKETFSYLRFFYV